jgi:hypothetical protein
MSDYDEINEAFEKKLDVMYVGYATSARTFENVFHRVDWDIFKATDFPHDGLITYLTKGVSTFLLHTDGKPENRIRQEFAFTLDEKFGAYDAIADLNSIADCALENRFRFAHNEVISYGEFPHLFRPNQSFKFEHFIVASPYWLGDVQRTILDDPYPLFVMEIVPLHAGESRLAKENIDAFIELVESEKLDILDRNRVPAA